MSFLLSQQREHDFDGYWRRYEEYLKSVRDRMSPGAMKLALAIEWYDFSVHQCPHDARLEEFKLIESSSGRDTAERSCSLEVQLLGAYHDGRIMLRYPKVFSHQISVADCGRGMGDWRYDEFRLSERGHLLHEIEWADGHRWLIEADDIEFEWVPFGFKVG